MNKNKHLKPLPIYTLSKPERYWLQEVYNLAKANKKINFRLIWSKLHKQLPISFRPVTMSADLIDASGEEIRLLGVIALEKDYSIFKKVNKMIFAIKKILLENPNEETIKVELLSAVSKLSAHEITFLFYLLRNYGGFLDGAGYEGDPPIIKSINIGRNSSTFYRYIGFTSIEDIIRYSIEDKKRSEALLNAEQTESPKNNSPKNLFATNPIFRGRVSKINTKLCFVLMPFKEEWSERVYRDIIRRNIEEVGLQCLRADDLTGQNIVEDIWLGINQASFIIADVTNSNPNVMYELGIVHTIGKPAILITQKIEKIPFDFRHLRHIGYRENSESIITFSNQFKKHIKDIYSKNYPEIHLKAKK